MHQELVARLPIGLVTWTAALVAVPCVAQDTGGKTPSQTGPVAFAPGVRIDWRARRVEVDGEIVLRKGPLELLACSPQTREHESIVRVNAQPKRIYEAMGLIGLSPGVPVHFDKKRRTQVPASGEPVALHIRYGKGGDVHTVVAADWLLDVERRRPPERVRWVFAGSRTYDHQQFAADVDGTVVCVVDFDSALITVDTLHTSDNSALWIEANTDAIPPVGTRCTLLIQRVAKGDLVVDLSRDGRLRLDGEIASTDRIARRLADARKVNPKARLVLEAGGAVPAETMKSIRQALREAGVGDASITVRPRADSPVGNPKRGAEPPG